MSGKALLHHAPALARHWADVRRCELNLGLGDKFQTLPKSPVSWAVHKTLKGVGVQSSVTNHAIDIRVDVTCTLNRSANKLKDRAIGAKRTAKRVAALTGIDKRASAMGMSGVRPRQAYGETAIGPDPTVTKLNTTGLALATGIGSHKAATVPSSGYMEPMPTLLSADAFLL